MGFLEQFFKIKKSKNTGVSTPMHIRAIIYAYYLLL